MNKRERVIRTLDLEGPDIVPIHSLGYEEIGSAFRDFHKSQEYLQFYRTLPEAGDITEIRWWNADIWQMDPFKKFTSEAYPSPSECPNHLLHLTGRIYRLDPIPEWGGTYKWYENGYFTTPERVHTYWNQYGRPSDRINPEETYTRSKWQQYVDVLEPYVYPMVWLTLSMHEGLFEGMSLARLAYYMRKNPSFIHELMEEYCRTNEALLTRFAEAGVEIVFYSDDLGQKQRSILSLSNFREFILPYYKRLYQKAKKYGIFIVQHSCGYIDEFLPDLVDAGLSCIQALEPTAGVNLEKLKNLLGDKIAFMGGMDSSRILNFGSVQEVEADVKKCIQIAAKGGGYFAGPSHNLLNIPWENILAFRKAIEKYRYCY
jgi:hypothetical protein